MIYPMELIALNNSNHELRMVLYKMQCHNTKEAKRINEIIKTNTLIIKRIELNVQNNSY